MTTAEFVNYARLEHGCEINPAGTANVIRLYNPQTGGKANIQVLKDGKELFPHVMQMYCVQLNIPLVEVNQ